MIKKIISISLLIFTIGCLYFMSKGLVGIAAAYFLIAFNVMRVIVETYAVKQLSNRLSIPDNIKDELPRKTGHMLISFITAPMIYYSFKGTIHMPLCIGIIFIFTLIATKIGLFDMLSRDCNNDDNIDSVKYYVLAALINSTIAYFNPAYLIPTMLGIIAVGAGDPSAAFIGKLFGKHKIYDNKTLEGCMAFIIASTIAMYIFSGINPFILIIIAMCGAIAELFADKYDNLVIQLVVAFVSFILL